MIYSFLFFFFEDAEKKRAGQGDSKLSHTSTQKQNKIKHYNRRSQHTQEMNICPVKNYKCTVLNYKQQFSNFQ